MGNWKKLPLPCRLQIPQLLYRFAVESHGYSLYISDLSSIWIECLDKVEVTRRASCDETAIDPSEDDQQIDLLLSKLSAAFNGAEKSSFRLRAAKDGDLDLELSTPLPEPLPSLQWQFHLKKALPSELTREIMLPALEHQLAQEKQIRALLDVIKEKDHILGRVLEKCETSAVDLTSVFPSIATSRAASRGTTKAQILRSVKGAAQFDARDFEPTQSSFSTAVETELGMEQAFKQLDYTLWLESLGPSGVSSFDDAQRPSQLRREDTQGFETQVTPEKIKKRRNAEASPSDSDDDLNAGRGSPTPRRPKPLSHGKLGRIGRSAAKPKATKETPSKPTTLDKREVSLSRSPTPDLPLPPPSRPTTPPSKEEYGKTRRSTTHDTSSPTPSSEAPPTVKPASKVQRKSGLGRIGGPRTKVSSPPLEKGPHSSSSLSYLHSDSDHAVEKQSDPGRENSMPPPARKVELQTTQSPQKRKPRLGAIGGRKAQSQSQSQARSSSQASISESEDIDHSPSKRRHRTSPPPSSPPPLPELTREETPQPQETEADRANRRREELRRAHGSSQVVGSSQAATQSQAQMQTQGPTQKKIAKRRKF